MATSPIYNWPEPDNTSLVRDGAQAMRDLGNAIDTTMGTMVPKSTYTAKGSIAAATAASTPANLSVGTNNFFLRANSSAATGLEWGGALTGYTPTVAATSGSITSSTSSGAYIQIGKIVWFRAVVNITNAGTGAGSLTLTLPINTTTTGAPIWGQEIVATGKGLTGNLTAVNLVSVRFYDWNTCIATGNTIQIAGIYEVA